MRASTVAVFAVLLCTSAARADVTDPTPYDYERIPKPGKERGTYSATAGGTLPTGCAFASIGMAKLLPNAEGTGGTHCFKASIEVDGTTPSCAALKTLLEPSLFVIGGTYRYNGDGTLCENLAIIGGPLDGQAVTFHSQVDPKGKWVMLSAQNVAYACPGLDPHGGGLADGLGLKIGKFGDDPPGSGVLPCTNP
jgi:hypothetical protein